jgi:phage shock protein E
MESIMSLFPSMFGTNQEISKRAKDWVQSGARLIDVRTPQEFASGHINGAKNLPLDQLGVHLESLGTRGDRIVVYCRSGARSAHARGMLEAAGFEVCDLGPMSAWMQ